MPGDDLTRWTDDAEAGVNKMMGQVGDIRQKVNDLVSKGNIAANDTQWRGGDRDKWMQHWTDEVSPTLTKITGELDDIVNEVEKTGINITDAGGGRT